MKNQPNSICDISYANTTDESETMKGDICWSYIDLKVMLMMVMGLNGKDFRTILTLPVLTIKSDQ